MQERVRGWARERTKVKRETRGTRKGKGEEDTERMRESMNTDCLICHFG